MRSMPTPPAVNSAGRSGSAQRAHVQRFGTARAREFVGSTNVVEGMVVLDLCMNQATQVNDLAVRWNCKAGSAARAGESTDLPN